uniref:PSP proline-rich domain-containing protein n=1 Tax=Tetradesmus obliquus TaxID=3088 RepID=A0A383VTJ0_TETOB|eukprot:jgi/Sobl393_1/13228/SZX68805.1
MDAHLASETTAPVAEQTTVAVLPDAEAAPQQHDQEQQQQQHDQQRDQQQDQHAQQEQKQSADALQQQHVSLHDAVAVEVRVRNITRQGLDLLENLLSNWAVWQQQTYSQGYTADQQLLSGKLALDVQQLCEDGVVGWLDTMAPVPGTGQRQQQAAKAAAFKESEAPPLYDRSITELLAPPAAAGSGINMLPGGAEATRRRQMAEARLTLSEAGDAAAAATKRRRLPNSRCFNCGSYAHGIAQCPKDFDQDRVAAAKAERNAASATAGFSALLRQRYFAGGSGGKGGKGSKASPYEGLQPGAISADLARALDMASQAAPPPWLGRMTVLGLPPGWMQRAPAGAAAAGGPCMTFIMGSDDEDEAEADGDADANGEEEGGGVSVPAADAAAGAAAGDGGDIEAAGAAEQVLGSRYMFPGINAPLPEGADADAWGAELDKAKYVAGMLAVA